MKSESKLATFPIEDRADAEKFDSLVEAYVADQAQLPFKFISLSRAFAGLQSNPNGSRIFAALLDFKLGLAAIWCETHSIGKELNRVLGMDAAIGPVSSDGAEVQAFRLRMDLHRVSTSYVLRYRSLWDKAMGIIVLLVAPDQYDKFCSAKSRKKEFKRICASISALRSNIAEDISKIVEGFDDTFRTHEAHGPGILRKKSFVWTDPVLSDQFQLLGYWNVLCDFAVRIDNMFAEQP